MRIATFNVENLGGDAGDDPPRADHLAALRARLDRLGADVLCLQEVNAQRTAPKKAHRPRLFSALDLLLAGTPYAAYHRVHSRAADGHGPLDRHNLVILSRFPVAAEHQYWHTLITPPSYAPVTSLPPGVAAPVGWDRPALHAVLDLPSGHRLHVVNLHLRAPIAAPIAGQKADATTWRSEPGWAEGFFLATIKRIGQALEVRLAVDAVFDAAPDALIAVCGDLNAEAREMPVRVLCGAPADTGNPALAPRALTPVANAVPAERRYTVLHDGRRVVLDHLLASLALHRRLIAAEIDNQGLADEVLDSGPGRPVVGSFHAPLVAEFAP